LKTRSTPLGHNWNARAPHPEPVVNLKAQTGRLRTPTRTPELTSMEPRIWRWGFGSRRRRYLLQSSLATASRTQSVCQGGLPEHGPKEPGSAARSRAKTGRRPMVGGAAETAGTLVANRLTVPGRVHRGIGEPGLHSGRLQQQRCDPMVGQPYGTEPAHSAEVSSPTV